MPLSKRLTSFQLNSKKFHSNENRSAWTSTPVFTLQLNPERALVTQFLKNVFSYSDSLTTL